MNKDLTVGEPRKILWQFALPMFISIIFQQLYNIADSVIVGNFAMHGEDALAAVGASYPITMIFMAIALGCSRCCMGYFCMSGNCLCAGIVYFAKTIEIY